jgi:HAD superfamily hydrolase (TIGR01509 family)
MLIIWDYFGVIAQDHFWYTAERLADGHGMGQGIKDAQHKADLGIISWKDYCREVANDIDEPLDEVLERYQHHQINQNVIRAVSHLTGHTHVVLSNASHEYLLPIMDHLGLMKIFKTVYVSSQIGFAKPDQRAYAHVLKAEGFDTDDSVMIDDAPRNIDAACEMGMHGIIYEPGTDFVARIQNLVS